MQDSRNLRSRIYSINNKGYKAYQDLKGAYDFGAYQLLIDHIQGDPFASPSQVRIRVEQDIAKFPETFFQDRPRMIALCDYLARCFARAVKKYSGGARGTGKSGLIFIDAGKQEVLERSAVAVNSDYVEARFFCGLPARGRTVLGNFRSYPRSPRTVFIMKNSTSRNWPNMLTWPKTRNSSEHPCLGRVWLLLLRMVLSYREGAV